LLDIPKFYRSDWPKDDTAAPSDALACITDAVKPTLLEIFGGSLFRYALILDLPEIMRVRQGLQLASALMSYYLYGSLDLARAYCGSVVDVVPAASTDSNKRPYLRFDAIALRGDITERQVISAKADLRATLAACFGSPTQFRSTIGLALGRQHTEIVRRLQIGEFATIGDASLGAAGMFAFKDVSMGYNPLPVGSIFDFVYGSDRDVACALGSYTVRGYCDLQVTCIANDRYKLETSSYSWHVVDSYDFENIGWERLLPQGQFLGQWSDDFTGRFDLSHSGTLELSNWILGNRTFTSFATHKDEINNALADNAACSGMRQLVCQGFQVRTMLRNEPLPTGLSVELSSADIVVTR